MTTKHDDDPRGLRGTLPESNPIVEDDLHVGAHVIYSALSTIDVVKTTPEIFWTLFGTPNDKAGTAKWLNATITKLIEIRQGMPR
jgi:hypothetical protein